MAQPLCLTGSGYGPVRLRLTQPHGLTASGEGHGVRIYKLPPPRPPTPDGAPGFRPKAICIRERMKRTRGGYAHDPNPRRIESIGTSDATAGQVLRLSACLCVVHRFNLVARNLRRGPSPLLPTPYLTWGGGAGGGPPIKQSYSFLHCCARPRLFSVACAKTLLTNFPRTYLAFVTSEIC